MHILLTRPIEDSMEMILKFKSLGHQVSHLPLLSIDKINHEEINFSDYGGIIFTSTNAVKFLDINGEILYDFDSDFGQELRFNFIIGQIPW